MQQILMNITDLRCLNILKARRSRKKSVMEFSSDHKSKIHVEEPDAPVLTGVKRRESIPPKSVTLQALDPDMNKSSLTLNVALRCDILASTDKSFVRGKVCYTVSGSVFQSSSPVRHGVMLCKIIEELEHVPPILMNMRSSLSKYRPSLRSFKFDLDFMIAATILARIIGRN